ncbi:Gfo/Idh/MocA family oxidoreductase [Patescibacteria group bacterium]|nr:Gfo/Idh/MocA family oxidoreductase [Patescibacteria group bacterium]
MGNEKKYNFCLIGAGRMGRRWARVLSEHPKSALKAVVDKDESAAAEVAKENQVSHSLSVEDFLTDSAIDAALIATPHKYLYSYARLMLEAGKNVFIEKPGSCASEEMRTLVEIARNKNRVLMVGYNYRFFDSIRRAKEIILSGKIGKINFIRLRHGHPGRPSYDKEWRMDKELAGGGVVMDQGVHLIDLINWFLPSNIESIKSTHNNLFWKSKAEENAFVILKNVENQIASIHVSVTQWKPIFSMEIYGESGFCSIDGLGRKYGGSEVLTLGQYIDGILKEEKIVCNPDADNSLRFELSEFISAIEEKRESVPCGNDALRVLEIVERIYGDV